MVTRPSNKAMEQMVTALDALTAQRAFALSSPEDDNLAGLRKMFRIPNTVFDIVPYLHHHHRDLIAALKGPYGYALYKAWLHRQEAENEVR